MAAADASQPGRGVTQARPSRRGPGPGRAGPL